MKLAKVKRLGQWVDGLDDDKVVKGRWLDGIAQEVVEEVWMGVDKEDIRIAQNAANGGVTKGFYPYCVCKKGFFRFLSPSIKAQYDKATNSAHK